MGGARSRSQGHPRWREQPARALRGSPTGSPGRALPGTGGAPGPGRPRAPPCWPASWVQGQPASGLPETSAVSWHRSQCCRPQPSTCPSQRSRELPRAGPRRSRKDVWASEASPCPRTAPRRAELGGGMDGRDAVDGAERSEPGWPEWTPGARPALTCLSTQVKSRESDGQGSGLCRRSQCPDEGGPSWWVYLYLLGAGASGGPQTHVSSKRS